MKSKYLILYILSLFVVGTLKAQELEIATETIGGTVVSFERVKIPANESAKIKAFWIGRTEVLWELFDIYVYGLDLKMEGGVSPEIVARPSKPYVVPGRQFGYQGHPALAMTSFQALNFVKWLSEKTGKKYRLLTEDEWEYVCKSETKPLNDVAWYWDTAEDHTHPVAKKAANPMGAYDMLGNVGEWVQGRDGEPVLKGGAWSDVAEDVSCTARKLQTPAWNATDPQLPKSKWWLPDAPFVGFRIAMDE